MGDKTEVETNVFKKLKVKKNGSKKKSRKQKKCGKWNKKLEEK